jgi:membrane-associated phospholipid phosphatase
MKAVRAAKTSAVLSVLFLVVYGGCNWITAHRAHVGTLFFEWERHIPFVPLMIIPYMSIDLFFVAAPFLCRDERELSTFAKRVSFTIFVAGICFLLFPLRFAFERPHVSGWLGAIFNTFRNFDQPYNLLPSLHIALRTILAYLYARHSRGILRLASNIWFSLIGFSTVLTYQHHVMDVAGGFVLAGYCFYTFREAPVARPALGNVRVGTYYAAGAIVCIALAALFWPWGSLLFWPAIALSIVAAGHFGLGPGIFRKINGQLPLSAKFALGPVLLGQEISLIYYRRKCRRWDEIVPGVLIGRKLNEREAEEAIGSGVTAVLDLTSEFSESEPLLMLRYLNIPILDLTAPTQDQLRQMAEFIEKNREHGKVYVHCKIGYSRSAGAVGAYLLASGNATTAEQAIAILPRARPSIIVRPEIVEALQLFENATRVASEARS